MNKIDKYNIDIAKIANYLEKYSNRLDYYYKWKMPTDEQLLRAKEIGLLSDKAVQKINKTDSYFQRNIVLREEIAKVLKTVDLNMDYINWIIKDWGGIRATSSKSVEDYNDYIDQLKKNDRISFKGVASFSKVASFKNPLEHIIYDSRVAYALNWIMLKSQASQAFFPMPVGRNSKLMAFDISVLIRLKNPQLYQIDSIEDIEKNYVSKRDKALYMKDDEAYFTMCEVIKEVNKILFLKDRNKINKPYYAEMLLFSIADTEIIKDITESISFDII